MHFLNDIKTLWLFVRSMSSQMLYCPYEWNPKVEAFKDNDKLHVPYK